MDMDEQPSSQLDCAFCNTPILPIANKLTVNDVAYHAGCWDRKKRAEDNNR
jgi:hypothetical protein